MKILWTGPDSNVPIPTLSNVVAQSFRGVPSSLSSKFEKKRKREIRAWFKQRSFVITAAAATATAAILLFIHRFYSSISSICQMGSYSLLDELANE
ncbi:unnamed protein product [Lactuca virosa]|uniref:Uncharacterized protein n=1 Tax=Lactuca virosa TaxID=75947 RepID=A0AAU9ML25_9ASTR|nr:unnamed protein product [Lactuca virosa]